MLSKEEVRKLVDIIVKETGKSQEDIAIELGYTSKNYISDVLSPSGKVTEIFIKRLKKEYSDILENPNIPFFDLDQREMLRRNQARLIRIESTLEVLGEKYAEMKYDTTGKAISQTLTELENEIKARYRIRLVEEKKKSSGF